MKCDKLIGRTFDGEVYVLASEAMEAIAELKDEIKRKEAVGQRWFEGCMEARGENVKLKRALWLARAERAKESHFMWCQLIYDKKYGIVKFNVRKEWDKNIKQGQMLHTPQGWADVWDDVERKCREKAEEYDGLVKW